MAEPSGGEPTVLNPDDDLIDRGLAAAFGPDSSRSVLDSLTASIGSVPARASARHGRAGMRLRPA